MKKRSLWPATILAGLLISCSSVNSGDESSTTSLKGTWNVVDVVSKLTYEKAPAYDNVRRWRLVFDDDVPLRETSSRQLKAKLQFLNVREEWQLVPESQPIILKTNVLEIGPGYSCLRFVVGMEGRKLKLKSTMDDLTLIMDKIQKP